MQYTLTYRKEESDGEYSHHTIGTMSPDQLALTIHHLGNTAYQYYVTEWDGDEIIESTSADEWLENYRLEDKK